MKNVKYTRDPSPSDDGHSNRIDFVSIFHSGMATIILLVSHNLLQEKMTPYIGVLQNIDGRRCGNHKYVHVLVQK